MAQTNNLQLEELIIATSKTAIKSFNYNQRQTFNLLCTWICKKIKFQNSDTVNQPRPLRIDTTGGAGVGKSHLSKAITKFLNNTFIFYSGTLDKRKILFLISTGVAVLSIGSTITHSG